MASRALGGASVGEGGHGWWWKVGRSPITVRTEAIDLRCRTGMLRAPHTVGAAVTSAGEGYEGMGKT